MDHSSGTVPQFKDASFTFLMLQVKENASPDEQVRLDEARKQFLELKSYCDRLPPYEDDAHRLTRPQVVEALSYIRKLVENIRLSRWR